MNTVTTHRAPIKRRAAMILAVLIAATGAVAIDVTASTEPASAHNRVCRVVGPTEPWWKCQGNLFGTVGSGNGLPGCYKRTVCS